MPPIFLFCEAPRDTSRLRMVRRTRPLGYTLDRNDMTEGVTGAVAALGEALAS